MTDEDPGRRSLFDRWADDEEDPVEVLKPPTGGQPDDPEDPDELDVNLFAP